MAFSSKHLTLRHSWRGATLLAALALLACPSKSTVDAATGPQALTTDDDKAFYAMGFERTRGLNTYAPLSDKEMDLIRRGFADGLAGRKAEAEPDAQRPRMGAIRLARENERAKENRTKGKAFMEAMVSQPKAEKTASGMIYIEILAGEGAQPGPQDRVKVNYRGSLIDGTEFDSSFKRKQPAEFPLWGVIPCWTEGMQKMRVGGKARLVCPAEMAYGERSPSPLIPPGSTLQFEIDLMEILPPQPPPGTASGPLGTAASGAAPKAASSAKPAPAPGKK